MHALDFKAVSAGFSGQRYRADGLEHLVLVVVANELELDHNGACGRQRGSQGETALGVDGTGLERE